MMRKRKVTTTTNTELKTYSTKDSNGKTQYQMHTEVSLADCGTYGLNNSDKAFLLAILADARWDGNKWESKLSIPMIQKRSGMGEKAQRSSRKRLIELGVIKAYQQFDNSLIFHFRSLDLNEVRVQEFAEALAKKTDGKISHIKVPENNLLLKRYKKSWGETYPKRYESFKNAVMAKTRNGEIFNSEHHKDWRKTYTLNNPDDVMDLDLICLTDGDMVVIGENVKVINNGIEKPIILKQESSPKPFSLKAGETQNDYDHAFDGIEPTFEDVPTSEDEPEEVEPQEVVEVVTHQDVVKPITPVVCGDKSKLLKCFRPNTDISEIDISGRGIGFFAKPLHLKECDKDTARQYLKVIAEYYWEQYNPDDATIDKILDWLVCEVCGNYTDDRGYCSDPNCSTNALPF